MKPVLGLVLVATCSWSCSESDAYGDDLLAETPDVEAKADGMSSPQVGTYYSYRTYEGVAEYEEPGGIYLTLKSDFTFQVREWPDPYDAPIYSEGFYELTRAGSTRYLNLLDLERYAYEIDGGALLLRAVGTRTWETYTLSVPRCEVTEDCLLQGMDGDVISCTDGLCEEHWQ